MMNTLSPLRRLLTDTVTTYGMAPNPEEVKARLQKRREPSVEELLLLGLVLRGLKVAQFWRWACPECGTTARYVSPDPLTNLAAMAYNPSGNMLYEHSALVTPSVTCRCQHPLRVFLDVDMTKACQAKVLIAVPYDRLPLTTPKRVVDATLLAEEDYKAALNLFPQFSFDWINLRPLTGPPL